MHKNITTIVFKDIISFPCISSDLSGSDWCVATSLFRSPRNYYQLALLSDESFVPRNSPVYDDGQIRPATNNEPDVMIVAIYPKMYELPTFTDEFIAQWMITRPNGVDVTYNQECGQDFHKTKLFVFNGYVYCNIIKPLFNAEELIEFHKKNNIPTNITTKVLQDMGESLDKALEDESEETLTAWVKEQRESDETLCKLIPKTVAFEFADWCGEGYIKCGGGWMLKYASQIKADIYTTSDLYNAFTSLRKVFGYGR